VSLQVGFQPRGSLDERVRGRYGKILGTSRYTQFIVYGPQVIWDISCASHKGIFFFQRAMAGRMVGLKQTMDTIHIIYGRRCNKVSVLVLFMHHPYQVSLVAIGLCYLVEFLAFFVPWQFIRDRARLLVVFVLAARLVRTRLARLTRNVVSWQVLFFFEFFLPTVTCCLRTENPQMDEKFSYMILLQYILSQILSSIRNI